MNKSVGYWLSEKLRIMFDKFVEGFMLGLGLYGFYKFAMWIGWLT